MGEQKQRKAIEAIEEGEKTAPALAVVQLAQDFLRAGNLYEAGSVVLQYAVRTTGSEYGFFSVTMEGPYERLLVTEGFHWHPTINRKFYEDSMQSFKRLGYLDFHNMANLAGRPMTHNEAVLSNSPANDPRAGGTPSGHPPLNCFLGTPFRKDGAVVAVIGLANRPGGYSATEQSQVEMLEKAALAIAEEYQRRRQAASATGG
jgi:GAF domain-containing protein